MEIDYLTQTERKITFLYSNGMPIEEIAEQTGYTADQVNIFLDNLLPYI